MKKCLFIILILAVFLPTNISFANQEEINRLNAEIDEKRDRLDKLDAEIAKQRAALQNASGRADNLEGALAELEATRSKLETDISRTETEISRAELTIKRLNLEIEDKEDLITKNSAALAESIRRSNQLEQTSIVEKFLGFESMSMFWNDFEMTQTLQKKLQTEVSELLELYRELRDKEEAKVNEKNLLASQKELLAGETEAVRQTAAEKEVVLQKTKQEEAAYQKVLNEKIAEKEAFEAELADIESQLSVLVDPGSYSEARQGSFGWPTENFYITQYFGRTDFAQSSGLYKHSSHNGMDFGVPIGTKVFSVYNGVVKGFGNTDQYPGCRSWGGWVLVEHPNGLSTLYAHLSQPLVSVGQQVSKGDVIALSGNTGVSTGPHLHLSVYATQGVQIRNYRDVAPTTYGCGAYNVSIPMAPRDAYLDPLDYLPNL